MNNKVSVVIPTINRPQLLLRAVSSVLAQTYRELEVVVVVDGPDEATISSLNEVQDVRVRVLALPEPFGGADARNAGVNVARGGWIAFLDDDDEWLPSKISQQLALALTSGKKYPLIASRLVARTPKGDFIWPRKLPAPNQPLSEYLFARNSLFMGEGLIQTSTIFTVRELLLDVPFTSGLPKHQDWDWLLRSCRHPDVEIRFVHEPLAIWYYEEKRPSVSSNNAWEFSLTWSHDNKDLMTPSAYAAFILVIVGSNVARLRKWNMFLPLLRLAIENGAPRAIDFLLYVIFWFSGHTLRRRLRAVFQGKALLGR